MALLSSDGNNPELGAGGTDRSVPRGLVASVADHGVKQCGGDAAFECSQRHLRALAFSDFALVVGVSIAVAIADLGNGGHVDRMVELPVSAP